MGNSRMNTVNLKKKKKRSFDFKPPNLLPSSLLSNAALVCVVRETSNSGR